MKDYLILILNLFVILNSESQIKQSVTFTHLDHKIAVGINGVIITNFLYPDSLEKPVLFPLKALNGTEVTRGFPISPRDGEPTDHPHHVGVWFTFENVNGIDFWNNSYAIAADKKKNYGWIKVADVRTRNGKKGKLNYTANWQDINGHVMMKENTSLEFFREGNNLIIDRLTTLMAVDSIRLTDAKDGLYGMRLAHELQIPSKEDVKRGSNDGNKIKDKVATNHIPNGTYLTSEGKTGNAAWSTRGKWCASFGKIDNQSISVVMIDHPGNPNYPAFWHARGYGLFAVNPLGENVFTNGKASKNYELKTGEEMTFKYRIVVNASQHFLSSELIEKMSSEFAKMY